MANLDMPVFGVVAGDGAPDGAGMEAAGAAGDGGPQQDQQQGQEPQVQQGNVQPINPAPAGGPNAPLGGVAAAGGVEGGGGGGGGRAPLQYNVPGYMPGDADLANLIYNASIGAFVAYAGIKLDNFDEKFRATSTQQMQ